MKFGLGIKAATVGAVITVLLSAGGTSANAGGSAAGVANAESVQVTEQGLVRAGVMPRSGYFEQALDNVHISSTPPRTASVHGWWQDPYGNFKKKKAKVVVELQIRGGWFWFTLDTGKKTVYSGGGSAKRANARIKCTNTSKREWRASVDVDIVGVADTTNKLTSPSQTRKCSA